MKKLILITLVLTLAMGIVWVPSVAAAEPIPITIHKTIPAGGPLEDFTFEVYRDMNNNGIIDGADFLVGQVVIVGAGTGVINSPVKGPAIIHEVLISGSAYQQLPDQIVQVSCPVEVTFNNELGERGKLIIKKVDGTGNALAGATFVITPDPKTGAGSLTVVDNGLNDEDPAEGVLLVTGCIIGTVCTVEETVAPPDYEPAPKQTVTISAAVTLTFVNEKEERGQLKIRKVDKCGRLLGGAEFLIEPNPKTGTGSLTVVDNGLNDEDPTAGILLVTNCLKGITCTVTETAAPPGYVAGPPQTVTIACEQYLKFVNTPKKTCCTPGFWGAPWPRWWGFGLGWR
jgi:uncharacterized surface anchored protein